MEQRHYETTFLFNAETDDATKELVSEYVNFLENKGAQIVEQQPLVQKKLAYPIQKKVSGTYQGIDFIGLPSLIERLETNYRRDERILRFLTVVLDKHAVDFKQRARQAAQVADTPQNHDDE